MGSGAVIVEHSSVHAQARQRLKDLAEFAGAKERNGQGASADEVCVRERVCECVCTSMYVCALWSVK
jgi:hypothetical protein